jgi:hypothetical protein
LPLGSFPRIPPDRIIVTESSSPALADAQVMQLLIGDEPRLVIPEPRKPGSDPDARCRSGLARETGRIAGKLAPAKP